MVLEIPAPEELRALAKNWLQEIVVRELEARGPRMDVVFYLLDAMRLFRGMSLEEVREITFEIGMLGQYGMDVNDPKETHVLRALPGKTFSELELLCHHVRRLLEERAGDGYRVDMGEEWGMAVAEIRIIMVALRQSFDTSTLARNYIQSERASHSD